MSSINTILWDADGVLIQGDPFFIEYEKEFGIGYDAFESFFQSEEYKQSRVGNGSLIDAVGPWLEKWKWEGSAEDFVHYWAEKENHPNTEMLELIGRLRKDHGVRSVLATNQEAYRTTYIEKEMRFGELLDGVYSSAGLGVKKPEMQFYISILEQEYAAGFENPLDAVMYFDDKETNVLAARQLGVHAYLFTENADAIAALGEHGLL